MERTKKEIFEQIVTYLKSQKSVSGNLLEYKVTDRDDFTSYAFEVGYRGHFDLKVAGEICKKNKWVNCGSELQQHYYPDTKFSEYNVQMDAYTPNIVNEYLLVNYDKNKDSISVSTFSVGYAYGGYKQRYYPVRKKYNVFCYSKYLYMFSCNRKSKKLKVRHWKANAMTAPCQYKHEIEKIMLNFNFNTEVVGLARHYKDSTDIFDVLRKIHGVSVPKALRGFMVHDLNIVMGCLKNKNELNSICQYISKRGPLPPSQEIFNLDYRSYSIFEAIAGMTIGADKYWLIRDYFFDLHSLKKTCSIKIKSLNRIEDEHRKMTVERMLLGVPEIQVSKLYVEFSKLFSIEHELISTKDRLIAESYDMHHCVSSRASTINMGNCGIYSVKYQGKNYTLDVRHDSRGYYLYEFRGVLNCSPPEELTNLVEDAITAVNASLPPVKSFATSAIDMEVMF